jgi:membrane-associated phospholipid phosphatase
VRPAAARRAYSPEPHDLAILAASSVFAVVSLAFPDTGNLAILGSAVPRGYVMGAAFALFAAAAALAGLLPSSGERKALSFFRLFYPQAFLVLFFTESIMLSTRVFGGASHDAAFAAFDQWLFGFQPAREFHNVFGSSPVVNEIMYGSYFFYYVLLIITPWITWLLGRRGEARRLLFISVAAMLTASTFYIFFRVQGPKYWFEDLRSTWYGDVKGGIFVSFFQGLFSTAVLSGAAFPSTHVAMTAVTAYIAYRTDRRLLPFYLAASALILSSTIYIYAHYFADVLGGLAYALAAVPLISRAYPGASRLCESLGAALSGRAGRLDSRIGEGERRREAPAGGPSPARSGTVMARGSEDAGRSLRHDGPR